MNRRDLLLLLGGLGFTGLIRPRPALAMGGTLPALEQPAPAFRLDGVAPGDTGSVRETRLALEDFAERWLVLYFYPKDFTSGCTLEARGFQRDLERFHRRGAEVVGVSADDSDSHSSFCGSEGLAFPLLSDPGGAVSRTYGSWIAPFSQRHTFLIDPRGILRARWTAVRPVGHSEEVLRELERLQRASPATAVPT
jgi:peroxiredoxin Q/BCP